ncbi:ECF-type sigma factor [Aliikangiella coralliicola]|uniref:ECF-type sigma factor n=1 Tax=Aliikangiella coralliicola TaxID=2592383 RepID=UPI00143CD0CA|nr:ECF-type sigma factor [Aliikangiella coralliicola]
MSSNRDITEKLKQWNCKDPRAWDSLLPDIYRELKLKAKQVLARKNAKSLEPTILVHELYFDFKNYFGVQWKDSNHFFAIAALAMRQIIVNEVTRLNAEKRGGRLVRVTAKDFEFAETGKPTVDIIDLDKALSKLEQNYPESCRVVELRFFVGLTEKEVAEVLEISEQAVQRHWAWSKSWLMYEMDC